MCENLRSAQVSAQFSFCPTPSLASEAMVRPGVKLVTPEVACARLAARQRGCIRKEQAIALGVSEHSLYRAVATGKMQRVFPGVYRMAASETGWYQRVAAASLYVGGEGALSHASAAALHKIAGFPSGPLHVSTTRAIRSRPGLKVHRVERLHRHEIGQLGCIRLTTPTRTLLDLSRCTDEETYEIAFHDCLYRKLASLPRLKLAGGSHFAHTRKGKRRFETLLDLYNDCPEPPESPLEVRVLRLLRKDKFPPPERQVPVTAPDGTTYRIDLAYPSAMVAIEIDSYRWHSDRISWGVDRKKLAVLRSLGWDALVVTFEDAVTSPNLFLSNLHAALADTLL